MKSYSRIEHRSSGPQLRLGCDAGLFGWLVKKTHDDEDRSHKESCAAEPVVRVNPEMA